MTKEILKIKGLVPYIIVIFLNAIVDLGDKILLQNTIFKVYDGSTQIVLTALVNALVLLPFVMFFTPAGFLSDRFRKNWILQQSSKLAFGIVIAIMIAYLFGWFKISLFLTFLLAFQSAIFSPAKYGLIKELFGKDRLTEGNAIVQAVTIIAILLSSLLFSLAFEALCDGSELSASDILQSIWPITLILVGLAYLQVKLTKNIPSYVAGDQSLKLDKDKYIKLGYLKENLKLATSNRVILESILGLSLFYAVSQVLLAIFGVHLKDVANIDNTVVAQGIMALAGVGIAVGSVLTMQLSKNYIETGLLPIGAIGAGVMIAFISNSTSLYALATEFFIFGIFGGFLIVVLNALIQYRAHEHELGRIMAASNFSQTFLMLIFLVITMLTALYNVSVGSIFNFLLVVISIGAIYAFITLPQFLLRLVFKVTANFRYTLKTHGLENFPKDGAALLLGNHVSWIDWMVLSIATPRRVSFVIERNIYEKWYLKPIFKFFGLIPISSRASKESIKDIREKLDEGKIVALFPEGSITRNGHLGKFAKGYELAVKDSDVPIIPFYIRGLWGSRFSYAHKKQKENVMQRDRDIGVSFGKPLKSSTTAQELKKVIFELQIESWSEYIETLPPLANAWIKMAKRSGRALAIADSTGTELGAQKFAAVVKTFAKEIDKRSKDEQNIGIIMPSSAGGSIINMATLMLGKTIVNLNYTANRDSLIHAIKLADIKSIYTSKKFITKLKAKGIDLDEVLKNAEKIIYVEDIKRDIKKIEVLKNWATIKILPTILIEKLWIKKVDIDSTAAILFSSGSEGVPKGIELTHKNFMGNIKQFGYMLNFKKDDIILATLPTFHVFGLTVTMLAPLIEGVPFVAQPDPTDAEGVGKLAAKYRATLLFGTSTFFRIYAKNRKLIPHMFESIRFVVGGAEKVSEDVRNSFKQKFGLDIYEAYGATEATPGISANIPDMLNTKYWNLQIGHKKGTVGMPLPGSACKIVDPETYEELPVGEEGMIIVGGTQVMKGYLKNPEKTKEVIIEKDGVRWYITGDKGKMDKDGFLTIVDRYSRFAKIAGEMVSLGAVEEAIRAIIPEDVDIVAANAPDAKKGEKVVLLYNGDIKEEDLKKMIKESSLNPLMQPSEYYYLEEMPKLGSGKTDLKMAKKIATKLSS
jgi:acyl-[acyl-carrier-protein]-phospholipid O-acyltransferase/long-chain-fatty-acid--[acyl-carrier-protein] ligase